MARVFVDLKQQPKIRVYSFNGSFDKSDVKPARWCKRKHRHRETSLRRDIQKKLKNFDGVETAHLCVSSLTVQYNSKKIRHDAIELLDRYIQGVLESYFQKPELFTDIKIRGQKLVITISEE